MRYNEFHSDLEYSLEKRENEIFDSFYYRIFPGLKLIEFAKDIGIQRKGIDKILYFESGRQITIDEKKRREDYGDILLELWSVWEQKKRGWMFTAQCDYIVYAVMPSQKVYLLPVLLLRRAWLNNKEKWIEKAKDNTNKQYKIISAQNPGYVTISIAIPTNELLAAISREMTQTLANVLDSS